MKGIRLLANVIFLLLSWACSAQDNAFLHVEVTMEAHGFMCPFLTPMFIGFLEDRGAEWVQHDPDASSIEFAMPLDSAIQQDFTDRLVLIGYEAKQIGFEHCFVASFANDYIGYAHRFDDYANRPSGETLAMAMYENVMGVFGHEAGERLLEAAVSGLKKLGESKQMKVA